ncbi:hypothetical protein F7725_015452 [Dissostichus mawsoni]|uniref:Uncharacterized protein n=1 Tax=Dissostichus mawsoni TaxID=36200 RepID=A0A7J5YHM8_DISMA|nr:hypothetical protein F7725_015452 [Dissostichus mawsoni]
MALSLFSPCGFRSDEDKDMAVFESTAAEHGGPSRPGLPEISVISPGLDPRPSIIEQAIDVLKREVQRQREEKEVLEADVREQVVSEVMVVISAMQDGFSRTFEAQRALFEERCETKISILQKHWKRFYSEELKDQIHLDLQKGLMHVKADLRQKAETLAQTQLATPLSAAPPTPGSCNKRGCRATAPIDTENRPPQKRPFFRRQGTDRRMRSADVILLIISHRFLLPSSIHEQRG